MEPNYKPKIALFHCINSFNEGLFLPLNGRVDVALNVIRLACSSMIKDIVLLKAFEAGADAVLVMVCPEGQCRYVEGNIRAKKRTQWVKSLLDEIGLDGRRLSISHMSLQDTDAPEQIIQETLAVLNDLGPNPAV
ncbi:MAG: hydrogenase iron-sulfur subunit [Desulfobacterales bacterium]|nr:MAG: hydrogenase iron-sulfur subunit [Desulfobacterales bacterium]